VRACVGGFACVRTCSDTKTVRGVCLVREFFLALATIAFSFVFVN
jgi:hypothetical protein